MLRRSRDPRLNQQDLADAARISRSSMVNIERGRHRIQIHVLYAIARAFGVEAGELLPRGIPGSPASVLPSSFAKQLTKKELASVGRLLGDRKGDPHE
jgi:transcriptional regulator with XRE-family HTH domain